jgi:hypothetical protein
MPPSSRSSATFAPPAHPPEPPGEGVHTLVIVLAVAGNGKWRHTPPGNVPSLFRRSFDPLKGCGGAGCVSRGALVLPWATPPRGSLPLPRLAHDAPPLLRRKPKVGYTF